MGTKTKEPKLNTKLKLFISQTIMETINDPDFGLELREKIKKRLEKIRERKKKTISLEEIKKRYL